jgi:N-acetylmuramoyl-L-alanine amidase
MIGSRIVAPITLAVVLLSGVIVPEAFAAKPPSGGSTIDPATHCSAGGPTVITLDPGHGALDSGTGYDFDKDGANDLLEKSVVLDIAELTRERLKGYGYTVCLTRIADDENPGNSERGQFANTVGSSLFVMIHLNGSSDRTVN